MICLIYWTAELMPLFDCDLQNWWIKSLSSSVIFELVNLSLSLSVIYIYELVKLNLSLWFKDVV